MAINYCESEKTMPCGDRTIHITPTNRARTRAFKEKTGEKYVLCNGNTALAQLTAIHFSDADEGQERETVTLVNWKAMKKGHGYGRQLMACVMESKPDVWQITADGLTEMGEKNIEKALPNFRVIMNNRVGWTGFSIAMLWRQDAIDNHLAHQNKHRTFMYVDPKLHSKYKKDANKK